MKVPFLPFIGKIPWFKVTAVGTFLFFMGFMLFVGIFTHARSPYTTKIRAQKIQEIRNEAIAQKRNEQTQSQKDH
ncbi:MAG: hypothetical protein ACI9S8_000210 [Chlamydiales bacterium]|jgi:hypothetical protein